MKKKLLVCPVDYFDVVYKINPWMDPSKRVASDNAKREWEELISVYKDLKLDVDTIAPVNGLPDMVFTANGFFSVNGKAVLARFRYKERQGETSLFNTWLSENNIDVSDPKEVVYEGEGDTFLVEDRIYQGWGFRSDRKIVEFMELQYPTKRVIPLRLVDDRFYHLDTCFFPVNSELVYYFDKAFDKKSLKLITSTFKTPISITEEEAMTFSLNSVTTDHTVVMNAKSNKFRDRVKAEGYKVIQVPMNEFMKSGGSVKCLTNEIWEE